MYRIVSSSAKKMFWWISSVRKVATAPLEILPVLHVAPSERSVVTEDIIPRIGPASYSIISFQVAEFQPRRGAQCLLFFHAAKPDSQCALVRDRVSVEILTPNSNFYSSAGQWGPRRDSPLEEVEVFATVENISFKHKYAQTTSMLFTRMQLDVKRGSDEKGS